MKANGEFPEHVTGVAEEVARSYKGWVAYSMKSRKLRSMIIRFPDGPHYTDADSITSKFDLSVYDVIIKRDIVGKTITSVEISEKLV